MLVDEEDMEIGALVMPRRRQRELVADPLHPFVRSGDDRQLKREVGCGTSHWPNYGEVAAHRYRRRLRRAGATLRNEIEARLVGGQRAANRPGDHGNAHV